MTKNAIPLPEYMDINACTQLQRTVQEALAHHPQLELWAEDVQRISTIGVQWLVTALKSAQENHKEIVIRNVSPTLAAATIDLGLGKYLPEHKEQTT